MRHARGLFLLSALVSSSGPALVEAASGWERVAVAPEERVVTAVAVDPSVPVRVLAASPRALYETLDGGTKWHHRFHTPGGADIQALAIDPAFPSIVLAATDQGLYGSFDGGAQWQRLFRGAGDGASRCTHVAFHPTQRETVLLGTANGLFRSTDRGRSWVEVGVPLAARQIVHLAWDPQRPDHLYLLTAGGLFEGDLKDGRWERRLTVLQTPDASGEEPTEPVEESTGSIRQLTAVAVDPHSASTIYLADTRGLLKSVDGGRTWQRLSRAGLASASIRRLLPLARSPVVLYAATARGVARYDPHAERWTMLSRGQASAQVHDLAAAKRQLWAATDEGLYRYELAPDAFEEDRRPSPEELLSNFSHEPTMEQVREAAIRYAEVSPDKIAAWRTQARLRALIPTFNVSSDTNLTDFRHWDSGTNPDSLVRGERDVDWSATLDWELADLIWSDDQTSIDVRSKLMVELRDDIVDEVTRLYFERRRLQIALLTDPSTDQRKLLEQELRLQELTALIDGLTGGYFSRQVKIDGAR
ncbi:MAG: hypothetical protein Q8R91_08260 [Candidatus Omnitrophota bacterium]|nr:hypothetical protein [Candidatus Omnitrophota bacterium]